MDFPKMLKYCQFERHMTNEQFAKYLGKSRTWLQAIYSKNKNVKKYLLSERTIFDINQKTEIPIEVIEEYNEKLKEGEN